MTYDRYMRILTAAGGAGLAGAAVGGVGTGLWLSLAFGGAVLPVMLPAFLIGIPLALLHALLIGLPAYIILEKLSGRPGRVGAAAGGLVVGALPLVLLILLTAPGDSALTSLDSASAIVILFAVSGLAGGLAFRRLIDEPDDETAA